MYVPYIFSRMGWMIKTIWRSLFEVMKIILQLAMTLTFFKGIGCWWLYFYVNRTGFHNNAREKAFSLARKGTKPPRALTAFPIIDIFSEARLQRAELRWEHKDEPVLRFLEKQIILESLHFPHSSNWSRERLILKIKKTLETLQLRNFLFEVLGEKKRSKVRFILIWGICAR